ncbi:hypothetical protein JCM11251_002269 [Rhodosporidiobolus azoricus]
MSAASTAAHPHSLGPANTAARGVPSREHAEDNTGTAEGAYTGQAPMYVGYQDYGESSAGLYEPAEEQEGLWKERRAGAAGSGQEAEVGQGGAQQSYEPYPPLSALNSQSPYATSSNASSHAHPLYARSNAVPPHANTAYSHPAYTSSSAAGSIANYAPYQPYGHFPSAQRTSFDATSLRPLSSGAGAGGNSMLGTQLPPMSLALGGSSSTALDRHQSLPSLTASYPPPSLSTTSYPHSHYAYARTASSSSHPSHPSSGGSSASVASHSTAATAASALSSLSAAANAAANGSTNGFTASIPKPSTSSSVPNSPWAGPPPPSHLSLGVGGLAKRRRSATDAILGLPPSTGSGGAGGDDGRRTSLAGGELSAMRGRMRTASGEALPEEDEGEEEEAVSHFSQPLHHHLQQQHDQSRRGSDASSASHAHSQQAYLHRSAPSSTNPSPRLPPPQTRYVLPSQPQQRTYVLPNQDGTTSTIKEPRPSSPMQPPPLHDARYPPPPPHHSLSHPAYSHSSYSQHPSAPAPPSYLRPLHSFPSTLSGPRSAGYQPPFGEDGAAASNTPSPASSGGGVAGPPSRAGNRAGASRGKKRRSTAEEEDEEEEEQDGEDDNEEEYVGRGARVGRRKSSAGGAGGQGGARRGKEGEKKFVCPHPSCGRAFARNFNLQSHIKSHQGIREFKCPECDKLFARKHDCTRHCIAIHGYDKDFMAKATTSNDDSPTAVGPIHVPQEILPMGEFARKAREENEKRELSNPLRNGGGRAPPSSLSASQSPYSPPPTQSHSSTAMASVAGAAVESAAAAQAAGGAESVTVPLRRASIAGPSHPSVSTFPMPPPITLQPPPPPRNARLGAQIPSGMVAQASASPEEGQQPFVPPVAGPAKGGLAPVENAAAA